MSYEPVGWVDGETPVNAENLGKMDDGIKAANDAVDAINTARENGEFNGEPGPNGQRGTGVLKTGVEPSVNTVTVNDSVPPFRTPKSSVIKYSGVEDVLVGDLVLFQSDIYKVLALQAAGVYLDNPVSIKGETGTSGKSAYEYAQDAGYTGSEEKFSEQLAKGGASNWNDLEGRPFGMLPVVFDGNLNGKTVVEFGYGIKLVKVSDCILTEAACIGANVIVTALGYENSAAVTGTQDYTDGFGIVSFGLVFENASLSDTPYVVVVKESGVFQDTNVSPGTYFLYAEDEEGLVYTKVFDALNTVKTLEAKYLPDYLPSIEVVDPTFDGDITGCETVFVQEGTYAVKVSSDYIPVDTLVGAEMTYYTGGAEYTDVLDAEMAVDGSAVGLSGSVVLVGQDPVVLSIPIDTEIQGVAFTAGTWFMCVVSQFYVKSLSCLLKVENIRKMDARLLPDMTEKIDARIDAKLGVIENGSY